MNEITPPGRNPSRVTTSGRVCIVGCGNLCRGNRQPEVPTPGGTSNEREREEAHFSVSPKITFLTPGHHPQFFVMNISPDSLPNVSCFDMFVENTKGSKPEVVQGSHKFLSDVIVGKEQGPTNSVFIGGYSASSPQFR